MRRIVLRPANPRQCEVVTFEIEKGFVTPIWHHRTKKWHATRTRPHILSDGWPDTSKLGPAYRTKREAVEALG
jgi:hypothetical protein